MFAVCLTLDWLCVGAARQGETGRYQNSVIMTVAGNYSLAIMLANNHIKGSPFQMSVRAGDVDPLSCFATGSSIRSALAGTPAVFSVAHMPACLHMPRAPLISLGE